MRSGETGNFVVCPLSAIVVLALTWMGANGRTAQQLGDVLHLPLSRERVAEGFRVLMGSLPTASNQTDDGVLVELANRLYFQKGYQLKDAFVQTAVEDFRSGVEELDFAQTENARNRINQWVANNTNNRIQDLIPEGFLSTDTRLVLVNAMWFLGKWANPFDENETQNKTFYLSKCKQENVSMMHGSLRLDYSELPDFNATVLRLPYRGRNIQSDMLILLPNAVDGLKALENNLGQLDFSDIQFRTHQVTVDLPSFEIRTTVPLKEKLLQMGVTDIFGDQAQLSGISDIPLRVNDVVQETFIIVNENGTEAAAATAVGAVPLSLPPPATFNANHPFILVNRVDKNIAFIGRVSNPKQ